MLFFFFWPCGLKESCPPFLKTSSTDLLVQCETTDRSPATDWFNTREKLVTAFLLHGTRISQRPVVFVIFLVCSNFFVSGEHQPVRGEYLDCTDLSGVDRYFCFWNFFSRPISCTSVKMVRLRRGFFSRGVLLSVSDSLLMLRGVWLGDGSEVR